MALDAGWSGGGRAEGETLGAAMGELEGKIPHRKPGRESRSPGHPQLRLAREEEDQSENRCLSPSENQPRFRMNSPALLVCAA